MWYERVLQARHEGEWHALNHRHFAIPGGGWKDATGKGVTLWRDASGRATSLAVQVTLEGGPVTPEYLKWRDDVRLLIDKQRREALLYYRKSKGA